MSGSISSVTIHYSQCGLGDVSGVDRGSCGHSCCLAAGVGIPVGAENATVYRQAKGRSVVVTCVDVGHSQWLSPPTPTPHRGGNTIGDPT